jgi:hypothetical protein
MAYLLLSVWARLSELRRRSALEEMIERSSFPNFEMLDACISASLFMLASTAPSNKGWLHCGKSGW